MPTAWQGWIVPGAFFALVGIGAVVHLPVYGPTACVACCAGLRLVLVGVCRIKGEPPRWRWGDE